jgi:hypothetical protein
MTRPSFASISLSGSQPSASPVLDGNGDGLVTLANKDVNNVIYLGKTTSTDPDNPNLSFPLAPGASYTADGNTPVYAKCAAGETAVLAVYPGAFSYTRT